MADIKHPALQLPDTDNHREHNVSSFWRRASSQLGLFTRSFLLIALLMLCSLAAWLAVFVAMEIGPRATQMSQRVATTVYLTRTAMTYTVREERPQMLHELSMHEGLDVYARDDDDRVDPLPDQDYWQRVASLLRQLLGPATIVAWEVNSRPGFWVSFEIEDQKYWLTFGREAIGLTSTLEWISWGAAALLLSVLGAALSVTYLNRPLTRLARFAKSLSQGRSPLPLPESGAREIRALNASFNRMAQDLRDTEQDRELMLAGLSHDLRTPLTRMRLEIELSNASEATRQYVDEDLNQVDQSISKLMEYARAGRAHKQSDTDVSALIESLIERVRHQIAAMGGTLKVSIAPALHARIEALSMQRIVLNLVENALRYGREQRQAPELTIGLRDENETLCIEISDRGPGIDTIDMPRLRRPFARGDRARTGGVGTGLGLAIVDRLTLQARGSLQLKQRSGGGLTVEVRLPRLQAQEVSV
jgi:two-component system osmolarity sensor histidine kinase EnvZ